MVSPSIPTQTPEETTSDSDSDDAGGGAAGGQEAELRSAAGPGYAREWALFCDYTSATDQPTLPTTVAALTGFFTQIPARGTTAARRVAAIAAAHRNTGYLLQRPVSPTEIGNPGTRPHLTSPDSGRMIAACPTTGWPHGLLGRRDGFLIVLTGVLGYTHTQAREIRPADLSTPTNTDPNSRPDADHTTIDTGSGTGIPADTVPRIREHPLPTSDDPRTCPTCAVVRWLDILGILDGLGRGSARMHLHTTTAPTPLSPHHHTLIDPPRWRHAAHLLPAIDRHGWIDDNQPLSTRSIHTRLTLAAHRAANPEPTAGQPRTKPDPTPDGPRSHTPTLDEVLDLLDQVADDADALNHRIRTLLADQTTQPS